MLAGRRRGLSSQLKLARYPPIFQVPNSNFIEVSAILKSLLIHIGAFARSMAFLFADCVST
jgi:hypothetical protein